MSNSTALYYPNFRMEMNWLKSALLYWDRIRCIVPPDCEGEVDQRPEFQTLVKDRIIVNTAPSNYLDLAETKFKESVVPLLHEKLKPAKRRPHPSSFFRWKLEPMAKSKIGPSLRDYLLGLRREGVHIRMDGKWMVAPGHVVGLYMMCLGSVMADKLQVPLVTDSGEFERYGEYLSFGKPTPASSKKDPHNIVLRLELPYPSMRSLELVPLDAILRFREKFAEERARFREEVEKITADTAGISDAEALGDYLEDRKDRIAAAVKEHRTTLLEWKGRNLSSLLKVSCPTLISTAAASAAGWLGTVTGNIITAGALAIGAAAWWAECRWQRREAVKKNPWHYCLSLSKLSRDDRPIPLEGLDVGWGRRMPNLK
jgi:hypothetical protein